MAITKIQKGDKVKVTAGSYKGTEGVVTKVITKKTHPKKTTTRIAVSTIPSIIKYRKANRAFNLPGEKLTTDRLIDISNVSLLDDKGKVSKVKISLDDKTGKKTRLYVTTGKVVAKTNAVKEDTKDTKDSKETKESKKSTK